MKKNLSLSFSCYESCSKFLAKYQFLKKACAIIIIIIIIIIYYFFCIIIFLFFLVGWVESREKLEEENK